jgi:hypothetical protein
VQLVTSDAHQGLQRVIGAVMLGTHLAALRAFQQRGEERAGAQFGIRSSRSPAVVASRRARCPLRCASRASDRSCGSAPITAVSSASINAC